MLIPLISSLVVLSQLPSPSARISDHAVSVPVFKYPNILRLNKIQGDFPFRISIASGVITKVEQTSADSHRLLPHLCADLEKQIRSIQFKPTFSGQMNLLIRLHLDGSDEFPENTKSRVILTPELNIVQIETNPAKVTVDAAPPQ